MRDDDDRPDTAQGGTVMVILKACPRCTGDLVEELDLYEASAVCIQCGGRLTGEELEQLLELRGLSWGRERNAELNRTVA